jgi:Contractile injection system tube protein/LysM domain
VAAPTNGFQKAWLKPETGSKIDCWFNPKEYTITKANKWDIKPVVGAGLPTAQFGGGDARTLSLELLFDDSDGINGDVRGVIDVLFKLMEVDSKLGSSKNAARPPMIEFGWGSTSTFQAVAKSLKVQYLLFRPDGTPIRAIATIDLAQVEKAVGKGTGGSGSRTRQNAPGTNPTTVSTGGLSSHIVRDGDSLQSIAYESYGDPTLWRAIAEANGVDDPMHLRRGTTLSIPRVDG